jgi:hypothetical protein
LEGARHDAEEPQARSRLPDRLFFDDPEKVHHFLGFSPATLKAWEEKGLKIHTWTINKRPIRGVIVRRVLGVVRHVRNERARRRRESRLKQKPPRWHAAAGKDGETTVMSIVHEEPRDVNMRGLCVTGRDGQIVLSRAKYREVGTGLIERAALDVKGFSLPSIEPNDIDAAMFTIGVFAVTAIDDQIKNDIGIDADQADESQMRSLFFVYVEAFARAMGAEVQK